MQRRGEERTFLPAPGQGCEERSSVPTEVLARAGNTVAVYSQAGALVHTPHRTFPCVSAASPSRADPSISFQGSPAAYTRSSSPIAKGIASNIAAAAGSALAADSSPPLGPHTDSARKAGAVGSQCFGKIHCSVCGIAVPPSDWRVHQLAALHQRRLREHAIAFDGRSRSTPPTCMWTVKVPPSHRSLSTAAAGFRPLQRPAVCGSIQQPTLATRLSAHVPAQTRGRHHGSSNVSTAVKEQPSSCQRRYRREDDSANSNTSAGMYSTSGSSSSSASGGAPSMGSAESSRSSSSETEGSAACDHPNVSGTAHATLPRPAVLTGAPVASCTPASSFELPPVSPPCLSEASFTSSRARTAFPPENVFGLTEPGTSVHYVELTAEQRERRRVRELEKLLHTYLYYHEQRLLSVCMRRWYGAMFSKATAFIADPDPPKCGGDAEARSDALCSPEDHTVALLSPAKDSVTRIPATSVSPSPILEVPPSSFGDTSYESGAPSVPRDSTSPVALVAVTAAVLPDKGTNSHAHGTTAEIFEDNGQDLARRSSTQQPESPSASVPCCDESAHNKCPASCSAKCTTSAEVVGAHATHTAQAGVQTTYGEAESTPIAFLTTHIKSYARVHVASDGRASPAEVRCAKDDGSAQSEAQDLEVMRTDVRWVVARPASLPVSACSSSSESSGGVTDGRDWWSTLGRGDAARGSVAAGAGAAPTPCSSTNRPSQFPLVKPGGKVEWRQVGGGAAGRGCRKSLQPQHAIDGSHNTGSIELISRQQPYVSAPDHLVGHHAATHEGDGEGGVCEDDFDQAPLSEKLPEQVLDEPTPPKRHSQSCSTHAEVFRSRSKKARRSSSGLQRAEPSGPAWRTQTPREEEEGEEEKDCVPEVHQPLCPAVASRKDMARLAHAVLDTQADAFDCDRVGRIDEECRHHMRIRGKGGEEESFGRPDSVGFAAAVTASTSFGETAGERLCELSLPASGAPGGEQTTPTWPAEPSCHQSKLYELPSHPSPKTLSLTRGLSVPPGPLKCGLAKAPLSPSSITLTHASKESSSSSSSYSSSSSSRSTSIGKGSDISEPIARLSPRSQQRVWQVPCPQNTASLPATSTDVPTLTEDTSETHQLHSLDLRAAIASATPRVTSTSITEGGGAAAQAKEEEEKTTLGTSSVYLPSSLAPLMPQNTHELVAATTPLSLADILSNVLARTPGGGGRQMAASGTSERSDADRLGHCRHRRHTRGMDTIVRLPKTLLALHMLSARAACGAVAPLHVDVIGECASDRDNSDAAPPPLGSSMSFGVGEEKDEVPRLSSPSDHPYNIIIDPARHGNGRGGSEGVGFYSSMSARLLVREGGNGSDGGSAAELRSMERHDRVLPAYTNELATTLTNNTDEGCEKRGTDASGETTTVRRKGSTGEALLPSAPPPNEMSTLQSSALPSFPSSTALSAHDIRAALGAPSGVQTPRQSPPPSSSSFALKARGEAGALQSPRGEPRDHAGVKAQRRSVDVPASAVLAHNLVGECQKDAVEEGWCLLGSGGAASSDANRARGVDDATRTAALSHVDVASVMNSPPRAASGGAVTMSISTKERVTSSNTRRFHKTISDGPVAVLPSTNRISAASFSLSDKGVTSAAERTEATMPILAQAPQHLDPSRGATRCIDQAADGQPVSLDQQITVTLTSSATINFSGNASPRHRIPADVSSAERPVSDAPQDRHSSTLAAEPADSSTIRHRGGGQLDTAQPRAPGASGVFVGGSHAALKDIPSVELRELSARGGGTDLVQEPSPLACSWQVGEKPLMRGDVAKAPVGVCSDPVNLSERKALLHSAQSLESPPDPFAGPQRTALNIGSSRLDKDTFHEGVAGLSEAPEVGALARKSDPAAVGAARPVNSGSPVVVPTTHPYCYTAMKADGAGLIGSKHGDRTKGSVSATNAPRFPLGTAPSLLAGPPDRALNHAAVLYYSPTASTATAAARRGATGKLRRRSSSASASASLHTHSADVHPHRRKSHHHRHGRRSAASLGRRRAEKKAERSGHGSRPDGDASLKHQWQDRYSEGNHQRGEDRGYRTPRSRQQCRRCLREERFTSRHRHGRPQPEDADAAAAPRAHSSLRHAHEEVMVRGLDDAVGREPRYVAQKASRQLLPGGHPPHSYRVALPLAPTGLRTFGQEVPRKGEAYFDDPTAPHSGDLAQGAGRRSFHRPRRSGSVLCIEGRVRGDNVARSRHKHRQPSERYRTRDHRHSLQRMSSTSVSSTTTWASRSSSGRSSVHSGDRRNTDRAGLTHRGYAAAQIGAPPGADKAVARGCGREDALEAGKEIGESVHARGDGTEHNLRVPLQQSMLSIEPCWGERGVQPPLAHERGSAGGGDSYARADARVHETRGSPEKAGTGRGAGGSSPVRGEDVDGRDVHSVDAQPPPGRVGGACATMQERPAGDKYGILPSGASLPSQGASLATSVPVRSALAGDESALQVPRGGAHQSACVFSAELGRPRQHDTVTAMAGTEKRQGSAGGQPVLPQHGDLFYRDDAGRFHRVNDQDLPSVMADEVGRRSSLQHIPGPSSSSRRPLYIVHSPTPPFSATTGRPPCLASLPLSRRCWTITNPTKSLGCGRLNPYCSSCRAKYNLIFVDPQMRPVQWTSTQCTELDQMGDCRTHSGYVFGGGDTESTRDAMLVQQRLRSTRMSAWPELPRLGKKHLLVQQEDLDGPLRHLTPPPEGRFVSVTFEEDERISVTPAPRHRAPLVSASVRRAFTLPPPSAALSQPPRRSSPRNASSGALRLPGLSGRDKTGRRSPALSVPLYPSTIQSCTDSHGRHSLNPQSGRNLSRHQRRLIDSCNTESVVGVSSPQPGVQTEMTVANSGQPSLRSHPVMESVAVVKGVTGTEAAVGASASASASGMPVGAPDVLALCQEERRIKRALKQLLWRDLPQQRGTAEWEHYVRSLSDGLRHQLHLAPSPPSVPPVPTEVKQPSFSGDVERS
ncbi:hypothetical protein JKF63_00624 [Porcisia hertigi]|uniref:Uncharacterized protein n=1 Tax=Porcisia hertigi TaxID=2761500 RepID=A0A836KXB9_9TRYP|nr:hypothetical protein JKF63_00624 [Porcisia hertigi]